MDKITRPRYKGKEKNTKHSQDLKNHEFTLFASTLVIEEIHVSWNFRHIVNLKTMKTIHHINREQQYQAIEILTLEQLGGDQYGTL